MMWDRPTKIALAGMLVLAATLAAVLLLSDVEASPPTPPAEAPSTLPGSITQAADAAVAAGRKADTSIDESDTQRIAQATTDAATLRIHLRGVDAEVPWTTPLRVRVEAKIGTARNRTEWRLHLPVERNVAQWSAPVARDEFELVALEVTADDAGYLPTSEHWRATGISLPHDCTIDVVRADGIRGRVVTSDGRPVAGAQVTVQPEPTRRSDQSADADEAFQRENATAEGTTEADGSYILRLKASYRVRVVAFVGPTRWDRTSSGVNMVPELRPATTVVLPLAGRIVDAPDLVLEAAPLLHGHVVWADGSPAAGATVDAVPASMPSTLIDNPAIVGVMPDGSTAVVRETKTAADGSFSVPAPVTTASRLMVRELADAHWIGDPVHREVTISERIRIELPQPLRVCVREHEEPASHAQLEARHDGGTTHLFCSDKGTARLAGPIADLHLRAIVGNRSSGWTAVRLGTRQELDLEVDTARTELQITVPVDTSRGHALLKLVDDRGDVQVERVKTRGAPPQYCLFVDPGRYELSFAPDISGSHDTPEGYWLPSTQSILAEGATVRVTIVPEFGGAVVAQGFSRFPGGAVAVHTIDANGKATAVAWSILGASRSIRCILPAGEHTLEFREGDRPAQRRTVNVTAKKVTEIDLH